MQDGRLPGPRQGRPGGSWPVGRGPVARLVGRVVAGLLALACLVVAVVALVPQVVCDGAERAVLAEFSHYGGIDLAPSADFEAGSCAVFFDVQATRQEVLDYYRQQLHAHDWWCGRSRSTPALRSRRNPSAPPAAGSPTRCCMRREPG
jgi:hypothetical protein